MTDINLIIDRVIELEAELTPLECAETDTDGVTIVMIERDGLGPTNRMLSRIVTWLEIELAVCNPLLEMLKRMREEWNEDRSSRNTARRQPASPPS